MEPKEFVTKWGVTREELASLTGKSLTTINRWFAEGTKGDPGTEVRALLASIDSHWTIRMSQEDLPPHIWALYTLVMARKKLSN